MTTTNDSRAECKAKGAQQIERKSSFCILTTTEQSGSYNNNNNHNNNILNVKNATAFIRTFAFLKKKIDLCLQLENGSE